MLTIHDSVIARYFLFTKETVLSHKIHNAQEDKKMLVTTAIQRMESHRITMESAQHLAWVTRLSPTYSAVPNSITAN